MNRRKLFVSTAKTALAAAFGGAWLSGKAQAQSAGSATPDSVAGTIHGVPGSPSATISIDGAAATARTAGVRRRDQGKRQGFQAVLAAARRAAHGRAERAADHDRRPGLRRFEHFWRRDPDAGAGSRRQGGAALHAVPLHRALLAHAGGADHRPQPPLGGLWRDRGAVYRLSGLRLAHRPGERHVGTILRDNGYATSWFGKNHNTPGSQYSAAGPFDQWPSGMGFEYFYGFMGGETDQWTPYLFRDHTQIFPWIGKPGYNLTTDMADEAIEHMQRA